MPLIVGRDAQLAALAAVVGLPTDSDADVDGAAPREPAPPLVVVYGGVSAGKSRCVLHALRSAADHFALVDGTGVMTTRAFYKEVLGQLQSNARGGRRLARREALHVEEPREGDHEEEEEEEEADAREAVTITDAPPEARGRATAKPRKGLRRARRRRRRVDEERKGSEDEEDWSADEEDADENGSDDGDGGRTVARPAKSATSSNTAATVAVQDDGVLRDGGAADPAHASLNFLSFVKALRGHMDTMVAPQRGRGPKPTVFIALDHVETLLERGFEKLITCLLAVNDQIDYLHVFDECGAPWRLCVVLIARAVSLNLDLFLNGAHPAFIHFPAYTKEEVAAIVAQNLLRAADPAVALDDNRERAAWLRKWLVVVYDLLPHCHADWLEFQHVVAQMLPSFHAFFDLVSRDEHAPLPQLAVADDAVSSAPAGDGKNRSWVQLQKASRDRVATLEKTRRRHLFGYDNVGGVAATTAVSSGDPVAFIASSKLSRSCQLLLLASYLASFTPHEADAHFVSSAGGLRRKRRIHRESGAPGTGANGAPGGDANGKGGAAGRKAASARKAMDQQLVGPKIFELPRLMAIYLSLQIENDALVDEANDRGGQESDRSTRTRADIFTHLSLLVRLRLLQRASPPSDLDRPLFRCIADTRLVHEIARRLQFPLDAYLTTRG